MFNKNQQQRYPAVIWLLAIGMTINVTGNSFLWPLNTIYITQVLGKTVTAAGFVLMLQSGAGIFGNLMGGWLFDKIGGKRSILSGIILSTVTVTLLAFFNEWEFYIVFMLLLGFSNGLVFPSMYAMAGTIWPEGGRKAFNLIYVAQNLGVAIGSAFGGIVASFSFQLIFLVNAATFIVFFFLMIFGFKKEHWQKAQEGKVDHRDIVPQNGLFKEHLPRYISLMILSGAFVLAWIPYVQWQTSLSAYMADLGIPLNKYSLLWTINGALIVLGQPFILFSTSRFLTTVKKQLLLGSLIFVIAFGILYGNTAYAGFVIGMIIMTIAEMLVWPAVPSAAQDMAPKGKEGFYQGVVGSAGSTGRMIGPFLGGILFENLGVDILILIMIGLYVLSGIAFMNYDLIFKRKERRDFVA